MYYSPEELRQYELEKTAFIRPVLSGLARVGKGMWNMFAGGRINPITKKWEPLHGIKNALKPVDIIKEGPYKGMQNFNWRTGESTLSKGNSLFGVMKQEFMGKSRGDFVRGRALDSHLAKINARIAKRGGKEFDSVEKYLSTLKDKERTQLMNKVMREVSQKNRLSKMDYLTKHPGEALNWYGRNVAHKGFNVGLPAYSMYDSLKNPEPGSSTSGTIGSGVGSTLGMLAGSKMGIGGSIVGNLLGSTLGQKAGNAVKNVVPGNSYVYPKPTQFALPNQVKHMPPQAANPAEYY